MKYALTLAALSVLIAMPAVAQPQCNKRDAMLKLLADQYQESPIAVGVTSAGTLLEVIASKDGKTWTALVTSPDNISCIVSAGEGWRAKEQVAAGVQS